MQKYPAHKKVKSQDLASNKKITKHSKRKNYVAQNKQKRLKPAKKLHITEMTRTLKQLL